MPALIGLVALAALMLLPPLAGYDRYVIAGGSMGGALPKGAIAYERRERVQDLEVGDVITYDPPPASRVAGRLTHRIVWTGRDATGARAFRTQGDANGQPDPWRFTLPARAQPVVRFHVPVAGWALLALGVRWIRMIAIGLPALLIACVAFRGAWRSAWAGEARPA